MHVVEHIGRVAPWPTWSIKLTFADVPVDSIV